MCVCVCVCVCVLDRERKHPRVKDEVVCCNGLSCPSPCIYLSSLPLLSFSLIFHSPFLFILFFNLFSPPSVSFFLFFSFAVSSKDCIFPFFSSLLYFILAVSSNTEFQSDHHLSQFVPFLSFWPCRLILWRWTSCLSTLYVLALLILFLKSFWPGIFDLAVKITD